MNAPKSKKKQQLQRNPEWAGGSIHTVVEPQNEQKQNGWWLIKVSFRERETTFSSYYPDKLPTGRAFFKDIHQALYILERKGPLEALVVLNSVEGGLTVNEALDKLINDDKKIRYILDKHYVDFEGGDDKFFAVFFAGDDDDRSIK